MLRIKQSKNPNYYTNEFGEKENYYDKESKGFWMGPAKAYLGLKDELSIDEYNKLFKGQSPEGKNLTYQTGKHRTYDLTLSCNKDVSLLKAAYPHFADKIDKITSNAMKETLDYAQQFIAVRETKNGVTTKNFDTSSVFGVFHHSTSRELDPQEHYHCLLMPVSFNEKGKAYANDIKEIYKHQRELGHIFQKSIAQGLEKEIGLKTAFNEKGISRILGFNKEERDYFSKRKEQIEKMAGEGATYKEKDEASLKSRKTKTEYDLPNLQKNWNNELKNKFGFNEERLAKMRNLQPETKIGDKSFNKSPTFNNRKQSNVSIHKNIAKLANVKQKSFSKSSMNAMKSISSGFTKEQLVNSVSQLQSNLGSLQLQLSAMEQNDPNRLQVFSQLINIGFQLQSAQQKLGEFEQKEIEKQIKDSQNKDKEEKQDKKEPNTTEKSNSSSKSSSNSSHSGGRTK